jgi:hypothetical protein
VFQKPANYPSLRAAFVRVPVRMWANRIKGLEGVPKLEPEPGRSDVLGASQ